jgi:NAD(P)H-dependent flavin oxidoreductase YrpB (nitropropane dioxygenase family)
MHYVGYAPLAAAVSNAGGIGVVTALTQPNAAALQAEIRKTRALLRSPDIPIGSFFNLAAILISGLLNSFKRPLWCSNYICFLAWRKG